MELQGTGFTLREWRLDDAAELQKQADNPNVYNYLMDSFPHPYTMDDAVNWINLMLKQNPILVFVIDIEGKLAGAIGLEMRYDIYQKAPLLAGRGILGKRHYDGSRKANDQLCFH